MTYTTKSTPLKGEKINAKNLENAPALTMENLPAEVTQGDWGAIENMETTDLLVPKIFHMQSVSQLVKDDKAKAGDFCDSITGEVLAKRDEKLEIIVFGSYKTMIISKKRLGESKYKLDKIITIVPENAREWASKPLEETREGDSYKYNLTYNLYCLIPGRMAGLPYVLSLGSTKTKAAKKINNIIYNLAEIRRPGASVVFELKSVEDSNDQGSWYGIEVSQGRNTEPAELMRAHAWYTKSKSQKFVAVEEEAAEAAAGSSEDAPF